MRSKIFRMTERIDDRRAGRLGVHAGGNQNKLQSETKEDDRTLLIFMVIFPDIFYALCLR
jgi:hypothetical protein